MGLETYRRKRKFAQTPEPSGRKRTRRRHKPIFVIQKHDATRLHYDFRLEVDGVLKSWAVPKGPSLDPSVKRMAVETEDHPVEYATFEGVIPEGNYGAGAVIVWDTGTYRNMRDDESMAEGLRKGRVTFELDGKKLRGGYALRRFRGRDDDAWLLIKMDDEHADRREDVVETRPESAKSGRTIEDLES
jgi:DNA ligase D-like protein (predicted 3'-phosphoesterase)